MNPLIDARGKSLLNVASRCMINTSQAAGTWWTDGCTLHQAQDDILALKPLHAGWYSLHGTGVDTAIAGNGTIECFIEYPAGTLTRVTYGGVNQGVLPAGGNSSPDWCAVTIPKGAFFGVRAYVVSPNGLGYLGLANNVTVNGISQGATNQNTLLASNAGNPAYSYAGKVGAGVACCAILSYTSARSCLLIGDSLTFGGSSPNYDTLDSTLRFGEIERCLSQSATINCGIGGDNGLHALADYSKRFALAQYCSDVIFAYGTNSWAGGNTGATILAGHNALIANYLSSPKKLTITTLQPTNITGVYTSVAGQILNVNNQLRIDYNNLIINGGCTFPGAVVKDISAVLSSAYDASTLKVLATGQAITADGTHLNRLGCEYLAANLQL